MRGERDMLTYEPISPRAILVRLDGKLVGTIKTVGEGWGYFPLGGRFIAPMYDELIDCKRSLEEQYASR